MFDASKLIDKITKIIDERKEKSGRLSPKTLLGGLLKEAMASSRKLGGDFKPDTPDQYVVQINYCDWDEYYGCRRLKIESYLSTGLHRELSARQCACGSRLIVELAKDYSLTRGEFKVKSSFLECIPAVDIEAQPFCNAAESGEDEVLVDGVKTGTPEKTPSFAEAMELAETEVMRDDGRIAFLETRRGNTKLVVHAGDTIGVERNSGERRPDITLDADAYRFVSQIHGKFSYLNGWRFRDSSKNGTEIDLNGRKVEISKGEWAELKDGCKISFGKGAPLLFRCQ